MNKYDVTISGLKEEIRRAQVEEEILHRVAAEKAEEVQRLQRELRDWQEFKAKGL